ncbi:hypothetical protein N7G274_008433 [Stereocaulon virgatum]|uniref:Uncharacterized protein n=1 Tax=Stereocaulon virgatum TaxID=373712 RepID=A0ABR3ZYH6_9LECA
MNTGQTSSELFSMKDFASHLIRTTSQFYPAEPRSQAPSTPESDLQLSKRSTKPGRTIEHSSQELPIYNMTSSSRPTTPTTGSQNQSHPQNPSHFLNLPKELRTHIYALVLIYPQPLWWQDTSRPHNPQTTTAFLSVNQLIHTEALPLFYKSNTFRLPTLTPSLTPILNSQPNLATMHHITLHYVWAHFPSYAPNHMAEVRLSFRMMRFLAQDVDAMIAQVDACVAVCLGEIAQCCPRLRSLRVYMPRVEELEGIRRGLRGFG